MRRTPEEERATAIHEAGHAVIARVLGLLCGKVTVKANYRTGTAGYGIIADPWLVIDCWEQRGKYRPSEAVFRGRILAYMAGREAEEELVGIWAQGGDQDDQYQIALMLMDVYPAEDRQAKVERRLRIFARCLVCRHRPKIEALSRALIEQRTMSDRQVRLAAGLPPRVHRLSQEEAYRRWLRTAGDWGSERKRDRPGLSAGGNPVANRLGDPVGDR